MYDNYKKKLSLVGNNIRSHNHKYNIQILEDSFEDSMMFRTVKMNGSFYDARIMSDAKTTIRGGNGSNIIQFRNNINPDAGTYIEIQDIKGVYYRWLLMYESDFTFFPKSIIRKCNYLLKWKNSKGEIVERWCVFSDNKQLTDADKKEYYNKLSIPTYDTAVYLPYDSETAQLRNNQRFLVDLTDHNGIPEAWNITNRNVISKTFGKNNGIIELSIAKHQFNHDTDNKDLMIADYYKSYDHIADVDNIKQYDCRIVYNTDSNLKMGTPFKKYSAEFYENGLLLDSVKANWSIIVPDEYKDYFTIEINDTDVRIKVKFNNKLIGTHIRIKVSDEENKYSAELPVKVVSNV